MYTVFYVETSREAEDVVHSIIDELRSTGAKVILVEQGEGQGCTGELYDKVIIFNRHQCIKAITVSVSLDRLLSSLSPDYRIVFSLDPSLRGDYTLRISKDRILGSSPSMGGLSVPHEKSREAARWILEIAAKDVEDRLPGLNCGHCGHSTCRELAEEIVRGRRGAGSCPVSLDIDLRVNGEPIPLSPYPKLVICKLIEAFLSTLKRVPPEPREVTVKIKL